MYREYDFLSIVQFISNLELSFLSKGIIRRCLHFFNISNDLELNNRIKILLIN